MFCVPEHAKIPLFFGQSHFTALQVGVDLFILLLMRMLREIYILVYLQRAQPSTNCAYSELDYGQRFSWWASS